MRRPEGATSAESTGTCPEATPDGLESPAAVEAEEDASLPDFTEAGAEEDALTGCTVPAFSHSSRRASCSTDTRPWPETGVSNERMTGLCDHTPWHIPKNIPRRIRRRNCILFVFDGKFRPENGSRKRNRMKEKDLRPGRKKTSIGKGKALDRKGKIEIPAGKTSLSKGKNFYLQRKKPRFSKEETSIIREGNRDFLKGKPQFSERGSTIFREENRNFLKKKRGTDTYPSLLTY